jgi:hypothetical protein
MNTVEAIALLSSSSDDFTSIMTGGGEAASSAAAADNKNNNKAGGEVDETLPRRFTDHTYHDFSNYIKEGGKLTKHKKSESNFPARLHAMLSDEQYSHIITWMVSFIGSLYIYFFGLLARLCTNNATPLFGSSLALPNTPPRIES